jgi:cytochrome c oxidase subunit II
MMEQFGKILHLPELAAVKNGTPVDNLIIYIHWLMIALFIGWFGYFVYCLLRFNARRNPKADHAGTKSHLSTYIEFGIIIAELVILIGFAIPMWATASDVTKIPDADKATQVQIVAQQFAWNARYPGPDGKFGRQSMAFVTSENPFGVDPNDPAGKDDIQKISFAEMHVPVNKPVICYVSSKDVIHSFKIIAMRVTQDAIPGMRIPCWFEPSRVGRYQINCAQLCGNGHTSMSSGFVVVDTQEDYDKWLAAQTPAGAGGGSLE